MIKERCASDINNIGRYTGDEMVIELTSDIPVVRPMYQKSETEFREVDEKIKKKFKVGIVERSISSYASPVMIEKKNNGKNRIVNDSRGINEKMVPMVFPIPSIPKILETLAGSNIFSVLDMTSGFWQCPLSEKSRRYTAFSTSSGHWQYTVCPQGVKTGPSWFNLCVTTCLREHREYAISYFDDIVIFSKSVKDHLTHITKVMKALKDANFKLGSEKSIWIANEVLLLGFIINGKEIKINPLKIATVRDRPEPRNGKEIEVMLGLFQFFSRFIDKFAEKAKCLYELTKKGTSWNWTKECQDAYRHFVDRITSEPAMRQPDFTQEFIVHSDGSKNAIGGVLSQKINGVEYIIEYASRILKGAERNYGISDIECLAAVYLIRKWHRYLYGKHFTLYTDHKALLTFMAIKDYYG